ncbi:hypothetical protein HBA92_22070 [Ochrobactrum sp. MR28]|nr:hypothetical protein [Ochrobactrum sp. MR28]MBX8819012.1 hypothetical protein [Ochrobactrum sp. MR31]
MTRIDQLGANDLIKLTCIACDRNRKLPALFLGALCGEQLTINAISRRLRCKECGHRGGNKLEVLQGQVDPQGEYFTYRDDSYLFKAFGL